MTPEAAHKEAERLLAELDEYQTKQARLQERIAAEVAKIQERYRREAERLHLAVHAREEALKQIARGQTGTWFKQADHKAFTGGIVNYKKSRVVVRARDMLKRLARHGLKHLIIEGKSIPDWDEIDKLPEATLQKIGARTREKECFSYEIDPAKISKSPNGREA